MSDLMFSERQKKLEQLETEMAQVNEKIAAITADAPVSEAEMREFLPDVQFMFWKNSSTGLTWRQGQRYYEMRDILGMHYMYG